MTEPEPHRSPFARALDAVHLLGLSYFLVLALAGLARGAAGAGTAIVAFGALLAATAWVASRAHGPAEAPGWFRHLHVWWSLFALTAVFTSLRWLAPAAAGVPLPLPWPVPAGRHFDDALAALDRDWFALDVARWSERVLTPGMADVFMVFYALYFLMPVATLAALLLRREPPYRAIFSVALALYATYALYLLVPACGPRDAYVHRSAPLPRGVLAGWVHDFIRGGEPQPFDAFPSAHVVLGILCAWIAWPMGGWFRWTMAAAGAGTVASTVVLRYHYVVDDLAGLVVVAAALAAVRVLDARIARRSAAAHGDRMGDLLGTDRGRS